MVCNSPSYSIGIDLVATARIARLLTSYPERFPAHLLGPLEREQFASRQKKAEYLAGRFAAKEAIIKALRGRLLRRPPYGQIQIIANSDGAPVPTFAETLHQQLATTSWSVSIAHDGAYACATALCYGTGEEELA